ncbi:MAG TPA: AtpZ/AtpI family protein [Acidimicrobiia bacterium]|nr:AtpZ/AtpI family protein [Acidimicrobiia bacterium]
MSRYHHDVGKSLASENEAAGFFASILSGFLLGFGLDAWIATRPLFTVIGIIAGSVIGFWRMWQVSSRGG